MSIVRDRLGILCQRDGSQGIEYEGGDSMNWHAHWMYLSALDTGFSRTNQVLLDDRVNWYCDKFESKKHKGLYVRHPNPRQSANGWASYCEGNWMGVESRDQMTGKLCLFAKAKANAPLWRCLKQHLKRGLIFANNTIHNGDNPISYKNSGLGDMVNDEWIKHPYKKFKLPDITGPDVWALYIRGFRAWWLYPLLLVLDLHLLGTALTKAVKKDNDVISFVLKVITARDIMPTPIAWLASKVSSKGVIKLKLMSYWCGWRRQCEMVNLYWPYVNRYWR